MKHFTIVVSKPTIELENFLVFCGVKDPYGIGQWIVLDKQIEKIEAVRLFESLINAYPKKLNAILFTGKNRSTIVKQFGEVT